MTVSPSFTGYEQGSSTSYKSSTGTFVPTGGVASRTSTISYSGSSVAVGGTVSWNYNGQATYTATYKGYYLNNGVEEPLVLFQSTYYLLGDYENLSSYTITASPYAACYLRGTHILTNRGQVPVEALLVGDLVITASGEHRPIKWIGRRSYAGLFLTADSDVQPIRFRAGSLGDGLPHRDLLVSPEHAMHLDGLLIPARVLVNGIGIVREYGLERIDYFHVELEQHDVLLAEGAAAESFLEDGNRGLFHNADEFAAMYPHAPPRPGGYCAPRVEQGAELEVIWQRLAGLAGEIALAA